MTIQVNIAEAKAKLSELIARAEAGEHVVIARHGKPIVALVLQASAPVKPWLGMWEHLGPVTDPDFLLRPDLDTEAWLNKSVFPEK
jgi:antitoxin (DNA-binding transcriptional repressor) of toxin-antitoxin stability system